MFRTLLVALALTLPILTTASPAPTPCDEGLSRRIPARSPSAASASRILGLLHGLDGGEREQVFRAELLAGDIPQFLRRLVPVSLSGTVRGAGRVHITVCVSPDYLAVGSDDDFLLVPLRLGTALEIAQRFGFLLPTTKIVDAIHRQAAVRLRPRPLPPGDRMQSTEYYRLHDRLVREERRAADAPLGALTAGDKKDLVLTERLAREPDRVAIYGWHEPNGRPIQPLSTVHGYRYVDYSHGVRLVSDVAYVDGQPRGLRDLLRDPQLSALLTDEGPLTPLLAP